MARYSSFASAVVLGTTILVALLLVSVHAQQEVEKPFALLPAPPPGPHRPATPSAKALAVATFSPRTAVKKCVADFWWAVKDSSFEMVDTFKFCFTEQVDLVRFWWQDSTMLGAKVVAELKEAVGKCSQGPSPCGASACTALVLDVLKRELKPVVLSLADGVHLWVRLVYSGVFKVFGCAVLPGIWPFLWNTLMDIIILAQCIIQK